MYPGERLQRRAGRPDGERQGEWHRADHAGTEGTRSKHVMTRVGALTRIEQNHGKRHVHTNTQTHSHF